ncbi:MAG: sugar phosphate nucleotidyltransferase [Methanolobus sp.]|nr:sugar phosphate nucleotidyltransferase [Methanolobus sp.]
MIIPVAGAGKRLYPHTFTKPKPMVQIAGKPVIGHILDRMIDLCPEEVIFVVGYRKEQIISYVNDNYSDIFNVKFVTQDDQLGLGHAIYVTRDLVGDSPVMITLGDMIFKAGYLDFYKRHFGNGDCSGSIGVWEVDEPEKYGIVVNDGDRIIRLVEKPKEPISNLGIAGVYFVKEAGVLFDILEEMLAMRADGEIQLTDALQKMVDSGHHLKSFYVSSWYDCGHSASLLETNKVLLSELKEGTAAQNKTPLSNYQISDTVVIEPVFIGNNVVLKNSVVGPYVSVADNTRIECSVISNTIIGSNSMIRDVNLRSSIIGDDVNVGGKHNSLNIGDSSSIEF